MALLATLSAIPLVLLALLWWYLHVPLSLPRLPRIPFYVSILGLWSSMGQDEIYERWLRKPLEDHGAALLWFAGQWSILVTRPDLLTDMFRNEELYAKAGSQVKIPWSVIASLVGDNIINSHGENWRLYTAIMKPGMQKKSFDSGLLLKKSRRLVDRLLEKQTTAGREGILVNALVQKYAVDVMGENFLDLDFGALEQPDNSVRLEALQSIIKQTLFKPLYFNFPDLDKFPWLFASRKTAFRIMAEFETRLVSAVRERLTAQREKGGTANDMVSYMLDEAYRAGRISEKQFRDNLKITFLTAHENAQQLINSTFWELGINKDIQTRLRAELSALDTQPPAETLHKLPLLTSVVYELLRLYPPVAQLINRVTLKPAVLGGEIPIPARTFVGWNAFGVHTNRRVWGDDAALFRPERWGKTTGEMQARFRRETVRGAYIPFNAHSRKCLGQGFVLLQMKVFLFELVRRVEWEVDPGYQRKMTPGGILAPLGCRVVLTELD